MSQATSVYEVRSWSLFPPQRGQSSSLWTATLFPSRSGTLPSAYIQFFPSKLLLRTGKQIPNLRSSNSHSLLSPPVLIICNKQDADLAKGSSAVQNLMEKEIEKVRMTRSSQLAGIEGEEGSLVFIGKQGKAFEFKDLPCEVQFEESSAIDLETLTGVKKWICEKA